MERIVANPDDDTLATRTAGEVRELCRAFPAPGISVAD